MATIQKISRMSKSSVIKPTGLEKAQVLELKTVFPAMLAETWSIYFYLYTKTNWKIFKTVITAGF